MNYSKLLLCVCAVWILTGSAEAVELCAKAPTSKMVVNVKEKGAQGDGATNDSIAIQAAIDKIAGTGGTVFVPDGVYMVDSTNGIRLGSDMTLRLSNGAVIKAIPNINPGYNVLVIDRVSNVMIVGGVLAGERNEHKGLEGEWGMGVYVRDATNLVIEGVTARDAWGDGFYVTGQSRNVKFCSVTADNNRRQGLSIISAEDVVIKDSIFKNTGGTAPQSGIDIEPNKNESVKNVRILNSQIFNNKGFGILVHVSPPQFNNFVAGIIIDGNLISNNDLGGVELHRTSENRISNNKVRNNGRAGIVLDKNTRAISVFDNEIVGGESIRDQGINSILRNRLN